MCCVLYIFERVGNLSSWEKRGFNMANILLSSLVSMSLGSLFELLGGMLRWRLLADKEHTPLDVSCASLMGGLGKLTPKYKVDLILGMANPTGSLRLIWDHVSHRRASQTTLAVSLYLLVNLIGRFGIAIVGLTYGLNEVPGIEYPIKVPDWTSLNWTIYPSFYHTNTPVRPADIFHGGLAGKRERRR